MRTRFGAGVGGTKKEDVLREVAAERYVTPHSSKTIIPLGFGWVTLRSTVTSVFKL